MRLTAWGRTVVASALVVCWVEFATWLDPTIFHP